MLGSIWKPPNSTYLMAMALKYFAASVMCVEKYRENKISKVIIFYQWIQMNRNPPHACCPDCKCCALYVRDREGKRITKDEFLWKHSSHFSLCCCYKWWLLSCMCLTFPLHDFSVKRHFFPHYINSHEIRLESHRQVSLCRQSQGRWGTKLFSLLFSSLLNTLCLPLGLLSLPTSTLYFLDVVDLSLFVVKGHSHCCNIVTLLLLLWSVFRAVQYHCLHAAYLQYHHYSSPALQQTPYFSLDDVYCIKQITAMHKINVGQWKLSVRTWASYSFRCLGNHETHEADNTVVSSTMAHIWMKKSKTFMECSTHTTERSILPSLPQWYPAGAVTVKHLNLYVNVLWKDDGTKP